MKRLTDGEREILAEQEADVRGLMPDAPPTLGDVYAEWLAANEQWAAAEAVLTAAKATNDAARTKARNLSQKLGELALADVTREHGRCRASWVVMAGRLYRVEESGDAIDGWHYEVVPVPVRKLAV